MGKKGGGLQKTEGSGLQRAVHDTDDLPSAKRSLRNQETSIGRICFLAYPNRNGAVMGGTAFLIGPDLLLTNWHVVEDAESRGLAGDAIKARFGFLSDMPGDDDNALVVSLKTQDWLIWHSPYSLSDDTGVAPYALASELDYACVRLAQKVGEGMLSRDNGKPATRGWFNLAADVKQAEVDSQVYVLQHAFGMAMTIGSGRVQLRHPHIDCPYRMRYDLRTEHGSSGSPCFSDDYGYLVGLHHAGDPARPSSETARYNQGVPIELIVDDLRKAQKNEVVDAPPVSKAKSVAASVGLLAATTIQRIDRLPMVNRKRLRDILQGYAQRPQRDQTVLLVTGPTASGKSYSWHLIRHVALGLAKVKPLLLRLSQKPVAARGVGDIYEFLSGRLPIPPLPTAPGVDGAQEARTGLRLRDWLEREMPSCQLDVWLVVDGLGDATTPDETIDFFRDLAEDVISGVVPHLALMYLGYRGELHGSVRYGHDADPLQPLNRADVKNFIQDEANTRGVVIDDEGLEVAVDAVFQGIAPTPTHDDMERLIDALNDVIERLFAPEGVP